MNTFGLFAQGLRSGKTLWLIVLSFLLPLSVEATVNLQFYTQPSFTVSSTGTWGQSLNLSMSVANYGTTASGAFSVSVYLSPTSTYNASTAYSWLAGSSAIAFGSLNGSAYSYLNNAFTTLPVPIPSGLGSTTPGSVSTVYVIAIISQNGLSTQVSTRITTSSPDVAGYSGQGYGFGLQQTSANWGQVIGLKYAIANFAGSPAGPFTANVYLCESSTFGSGNVPSSHAYYLGSITASAGVQPGSIIYSSTTAGVYGYNNFALPSADPFGDSNSSFYIGLVINPTTNNSLTPLVESNYTNDCDQGSGVDYAPLSITAPQPKISALGSSPAGSTSALQFGNVSIGETGTQTVTISDAGLANLQLTNVTATGGAFSISKVVSSIQTIQSPYFPGVIAPNNVENWVVSVVYTPTSTTQQSGTLTITSNDPTTPTVNFALAGTGVAAPHLVFGNPVPLNTDNLIANYGNVADVSSLIESFTVTNSGSAPLSINQNGIALTSTQSGAWNLFSITSSTRGAIGLTSSGNTIAAGNAETWTVVVNFSPTASQNYSTGLQIFSNDPSTPTTSGAPTMTCALQGQGTTPMTINVASAVNGATDANPLTMNFGSLHATGLQSLAATVTLTNTGQLPLTITQNGITLGDGTNFQITGITSSTQGAINLANGSATLAAGGVEAWTISVLFKPTVSGTDNTTLTILSNDPSHGTEVITLNGTGLNQPGILVTTPAGGTSLPFGAVLNDGSGNHVGQQTFTIQDIGLQPLVVSKNGLSLVSAPGYSVQSIVSSTQGAIILAGGSAVLAAKQAETWTVTVGLDPTTNAAFGGTLNIANNDPVTPTFALALSGSGTTPSLTLLPTSSSIATLTIQAGQVYNINWTASDMSDTSSSATLTLSMSASNSLPASGLTTIATIPFSAATTTYAWRPPASLVGRTVYIYGSLQDLAVKVGSFSGQQVAIEAAGSFNLLSPLTTTSSTYIYQYLYNGKAYAGTATLQAGSNVLNITTPLAGGGTVVHQVTVTEVPSLLTAQGYTYDEMSRIKTYTNGNGITTTYTYNLAGNLNQTLATNGDAISYTYDNLNRRTSTIDNTGTTFYAYDDLDRVTSITYSASGTASDPANLVLSYQYDNADRLTDLTYPGGEHIQYTWDNAGRMLTANDLTTGQNTAYTYNSTTGQLQSVTRANGVVTTYGYDGSGRVNDIKHVNASNHVLAEYAYTLDTNGNATALLTTSNDGTKKQEQYAYDSLQRLVQVVYGAGAVAVANTDKTVVYTYDNNGNRLTQTTTQNGTVTQKLTSTYGSANQLIQTTDQNGTVQASYVYDAAGNRIQKITPSGDSYYSYDERNLLTTVVTPSDYIQYSYNGAGQRVGQVVDGTATTYVVDPGQSVFQPVQERSSGTVTISHVFGLDKLESNPASGTAQISLHDRAGSARVVTNPGAAVVTSYDYDAFGANASLAAGTEGFAGQVLATDGTYYLRARYYDPLTGTFLGKDPMGIAAGGNAYQYAASNPINDGDATGMYTTYQYGLKILDVLGNVYGAAQGAALITVGVATSEVGVGVPVAIYGGIVATENVVGLQASVRSLVKMVGNDVAGNPEDGKVPEYSGGVVRLVTNNLIPEEYQDNQFVAGLSDITDMALGMKLTDAANAANKLGYATQLFEAGVNSETAVKVSSYLPEIQNISGTLLDKFPDAVTVADKANDLGKQVLGIINGTSSDSGSSSNNSAPLPSTGNDFGDPGSSLNLDVGGVLINQAATLVGSNLADIKGATFDPVTKQIVFLGTNQNGATLSTPLNMDYFYTAIQAVYGSATPPYVTLDPPAAAATQWPYSQTFVNGSTQSFVLLYNPLWPGEDTAIAIRYRLTDATGKLYDFTYNFNCVELNGTNGHASISAGGRYAMGLVYSSTTGTPPSGLTLNTAPFQNGLPQSLYLSSSGQTSYFPVALTNMTGGNLVVSSVNVVPARQHREYGGRVDATKLGWVMFEADRVMKCLSVGKDNLTGATYSSTSGNVNVSGYKNLEEIAQSIGDNGGFNRLWFEPNDFTLQRYVDPSSGQATIGFQSSSVELLTEAYLQGVPADAAASTFATFFTNNYASFAAQSFPVEDPAIPSQIDNVPIFAMLQQAMQAVTLARFFHDNNIPLDQWWMSSYQPPVASTPKSVATAYSEAPNGSSWFLIYGGVQIYKPNSYVPSSNAQTLGATVLGSRPTSTSTSAQDVPGQVWNASGTSQGNVTAVSASLTHDHQGGNVNLAETDLLFASPGELPLRFTRYYQSSWTGTTNLGPGWCDVRYALQFSAPSWYDQNHLLVDGSGKNVTTATSGDTYLHSGTVRLVDFSGGNYVDFTSSLSLVYGLNAQGNPTDTISRMNSSDLPTFTTGVHQSGATLAQNSDGTFDYTASFPDGSKLVFDPKGNLLQTTDRHGHKQVYGYNASGQLATVTDDASQVLTLSYDATSGLLTSAVGPSNEGASYHYNASGLLSTVVNTLSNVQIAQYAYNGQNQLTSVTKMDGTTPVTTAPDVKGRSSNRQNGIGNTTSYTYVKNADNSRTTSAALMNSGLGSAQMKSDNMGRMMSYTDMLGHTTSFGYSGNALLPTSVQLPTPGRPAIQIARNSLNQPTSITDPSLAGAQPTSFTYNPANNKISRVTDSAQRVSNFYYTSTNNLQTYRRQHNGANVDIGYGYDSSDNLNSVADPLGHKWSIGHDALGRTTSISDPTGVTVSCTYDQYGNVATVTDPRLSSPITYAYDTLHRVTSVTTPTGSTMYSYDPVTHWVDSVAQMDMSGNTLQTVSYTYNNSTGQVTSQTMALTQPGSSSSTPVTTTYSYDAFGNVQSVTPPGSQAVNFNYNATGQLLGSSESDAGPAVGPTIIASNAASGVWTNRANQTMSWGAPQSSLPITGYSYAEDGSAGTTVNASGTSLTWNNVSQGQHIFAMRAVDSAGNWSPQSTFNLWVDTTPPAVTTMLTSASPIPAGMSTVSVSASVSDGLSGIGSSIPQFKWCVSTDATRNWSVPIPMSVGGNAWTASVSQAGSQQAGSQQAGSQQAGQTFYWQVTAQDVAGNAATASGSAPMIAGQAAAIDTPLLPPWALVLLLVTLLGLGATEIVFRSTPRPRH